jgi:hypothetical protein
MTLLNLAEMNCAIILTSGFTLVGLNDAIIESIPRKVAVSHVPVDISDS